MVIFKIRCNGTPLLAYFSLIELDPREEDEFIRSFLHLIHRNKKRQLFTQQSKEKMNFIHTHTHTHTHIYIYINVYKGKGRDEFSY